MSNFEFMGYIPTPNEKHAGIATVRAYGKVILRFKIAQSKSGNYFPASPSCKVSENGEDRYLNAFALDSSYDKEQLDSLVMSNVKAQLSSNKAVSDLPLKMPEQQQAQFPF